MKKTLFIKNAAILTISSLILRFVGIIFKVWLAARIGAEGVGLYQLVFSVYMFSATFATSGLCTAVTRLVSEELTIGKKSEISRILTRCMQLSLIIAVFTLLVLFFGADFIATNLLQQPQSALSLKILGFSLPFMGVSSCIRGSLTIYLMYNNILFTIKNVSFYHGLSFYFIILKVNSKRSNKKANLIID